MKSQNVIIAAILILVLAVIYYQHVNLVSVKSCTDNRYYNVIAGYKNTTDAADLVARVNKSLIDFFRGLKHKYHIDETDDIIAMEGQSHLEYTQGKYKRLHKIVDNILNKYNPDVIYENDPHSLGETSYTVNKGEKIYFCLRDKENPNKLVDFDTMLFVALHEVAHIGNYDGWGHHDDFWEVFKFILHEAVLMGIYTPQDFAKKPTTYCGLKLDYQPFYDKGVKNIWEV